MVDVFSAVMPHERLQFLESVSTVAHQRLPQHRWLTVATNERLPLQLQFFPPQYSTGQLVVFCCMLLIALVEPFIVEGGENMYHHYMT